MITQKFDAFEVYILFMTLLVSLLIVQFFFVCFGKTALKVKYFHTFPNYHLLDMILTPKLCQIIDFFAFKIHLKVKTL